MKSWITVVVLVLVVLTGSLGIHALTMTHSSSVAASTGPVPPSPWAASTGPVPPSPWFASTGPVPPSPWK